ncbi:MAG: hypothetical protein QM775_13220 [Pirellulales bacterium]
MTSDSTLFALRVGAFNVSSGAGRINTITFAEQGAGNDMGGILAFGSTTFTTNLKFGATSTPREGLVYIAPTFTLTMSADIVQASADHQVRRRYARD